MKLRKKSEARLRSVSLACFRDSDCGDRAMNDFLPALSLRAILYYLNTWNNLVSRVLSYSGEDSCNKVAPGTGYDFWKVPVAFWARKKTFKSKS